MSVSQYTGHIIQTETCDNNTALPLVGVLVTCSGRINDNMSKLKFLRHLWEIVVFRVVGYLLNMINTPNLIQNLTDIHFGIILTQYQFLETETSDRTLICLNQPLRFSGFSLCPISFFVYSHFKES